ncbi:kinetochore protein Ndc80 [Augochlora pura]
MSSKMRSSSVGRRSPTNPVRISTFESKRSDTLKSKASTGAESSFIPRPRTKSCDRTSIRASSIKPTGKTPLRHGPTTPKTPHVNSAKHGALLTVGNSSRIHSALPTGPRSLSADRISSLGAKGPKKDTRPLTDKTYQAYMLNKIDTYFNANQLIHMLNSNGSIKPVTLKMFVEISAYLVKMLGIKSFLTNTNYVEELPKIAKKLHYPGVITKSWLKTANAMHSWPNVLRWICWLVEICEVREAAMENYNLDNLPFMGDERQADVYKNTFFSMIELYNAWNDLKLDEEAAMVEKFLQELADQHGVVEKDVTIAQCELEEKENILQTLEEKNQKIDEDVNHIQEILKSLQRDEEKQLSDIRAKEDYIKTIISDTEKINADCNVLNEQIRLQNICRDNLIVQIQQQPMSNTDKNKILEECKKIENYLQQFDEHLQDIKKEIYTMDITLASINHNLTKVVLVYNKEIFIHLSRDIGVDLQDLKMPETGMSHPQIMDVLHAKVGLMNDFKELMEKQIVEKEILIELKSNELEDFQKKLEILKEEWSDEIKEKKNLISKIKTDFKNEEAKLREQIKALHIDIKEIQDSMPSRKKIVQELEETTDKLDAVRRRSLYIEESAKLFFEKFYSILGEHRSGICNILSKLDK